MDINRNDPCPCGSGQKFKKCHLGRERELPGYEEPITPGAPASKRRVKALPKGFIYGAIGAIVVAVVGLIIAGYPDWGVAFGGTGLLVLAGFVVLRDPPPPNKDGGDPSGINFGG